MSSENLFYLSNQIIESYNTEGFTSGIIFGRQGSGKTAFALKVMVESIKSIYNLDTQEAWNVAKRLLFFELTDALPIISYAVRNNIRLPVILFDDAGIWLSKYRWTKQYMKLFFDLYSVIRTRVSAVLFTTPSPDDIAKFLREKSWFYVRVGIHDRKKRSSKETTYETQFAQDSRGNFYQKYVKVEEKYFVHIIPNDVYNEYSEARRIVEARITDELSSELNVDTNTSVLPKELNVLFRK